MENFAVRAHQQKNPARSLLIKSQNKKNEATVFEGHCIVRSDVFFE